MVLLLAQATATPQADPVTDLVRLLEAFGDGAASWTVKLGLVLVLAVGLLRKYASRLPWGVGAFFGSSEGGSLLLFLTAFGASFGAALAAGRPLTGTLAWGTAAAALTVAGGFHVVFKPIWLRFARPLLSRWLPGLFPPPAPVAPTP